jgi:hypothetical protein
MHLAFLRLTKYGFRLYIYLCMCFWFSYNPHSNTLDPILDMLCSYPTNELIYFSPFEVYLTIQLQHFMCFYWSRIPLFYHYFVFSFSRLTLHNTSSARNYVFGKLRAVCVCVYLEGKKGLFSLLL